MKYEYNSLPIGKTKKNKHEEEFGLIKEIVNSNINSICFTYDNNYEAQIAGTIIRKGIVNRKLSVVVMQRKNKVYVIKEGVLDDKV